MEFMSRGNRPGQTGGSNNSSQTTGGTPVSNVNQPANSGKAKKGSGLASLGSAILLFAIPVLLLAVLGSIVFGGKSVAGEFKNVDTSKLQAVFLNGGQVYFGRIQGLNPQFMRLSDIYYLRVNQQVQPGQEQQQAANDISLVKLGCELHGPTDEMVINREQVIFWENLKADGQVAKAVDEYKKQNPEGQKCDQPQAGGAGGSTAPTTTPTTPRTPTTTPATPTTPNNNQNQR